MKYLTVIMAIELCTSWLAWLSTFPFTFRPTTFTFTTSPFLTDLFLFFHPFLKHLSVLSSFNVPHIATSATLLTPASLVSRLYPLLFKKSTWLNARIGSGFG